MSDARILDRGYRRYDGPRLGVGATVRSLAVQTVQRALGLRRSAWSKIIPFGTVAIAYLPAIVFVGASVFFGDAIARAGGIRLPSYGQYYGFVSAAIFVFAAFVAPEVLCTDRKTGMLGLYFASPLTRSTYLLGKLLAVLGVLALVTLGPPLFMLVAYTVNGRGPDGLVDPSPASRTFTIGTQALDGGCSFRFPFRGTSDNLGCIVKHAVCPLGSVCTRVGEANVVAGAAVHEDLTHDEALNSPWATPGVSPAGRSIGPPVSARPRRARGAAPRSPPRARSRRTGRARR